MLNLNTNKKLEFKKNIIDEIINSNLDLNNLSEKSLYNHFNGKIQVSISSSIITLMSNSEFGDIYINLDLNNLSKLKVKRRLKKLNKL